MEVIELIHAAARDRFAITAAGAQTSTTGASICDRGVVLSLRALAGIIDVDINARTARVQPGLLLGDLQRALQPLGLFFAPDPTSEAECTVGGAIACNASGPRTLRYGATRAHVNGLTVVVASGETVTVRRKHLEKNTVGYQAVQEPVDWFVGSEGTLGIIVEAELALLPRPAREVGLGIQFPDEARALSFITAARRSPDVAARCLEYFDAESFSIVRAHSNGWSAAAGATLVYAEESSHDEVIPLDEWMTLAGQFGASDADVRVYEGGAAIRDARHFRHAVPSAMHERAAPFLNSGGRRVSTDWAVPFADAAHAIAIARRHARVAGIEPGIIYGHLGNGHPHQNFVARNPEEVRTIEAVVEQTLRDVIAMGGTVAAEHGIGKVKSKWLALQLSAQQRAVLLGIRRALDPTGMFAPGNIA
jgi:FAD/FMN-containing dehydrogenase